jgi:hypothetical protein
MTETRASARTAARTRWTFRRANATFGRLGLDLILLELCLGAGMRRFRRLEVGASFAKACGKILFVELGEDLTRLHQLVNDDEQLLDNAVRLGLDFDLRDRLHLAGGDDGPHHRAPLSGREPGRVDVGRCPRGGLEKPHAAAPSRMTTATAASHFFRPALSNDEGPFVISASCLAPAVLRDTSCDDLSAQKFCRTFYVDASDADWRTARTDFPDSTRRRAHRGARHGRGLHR